MSHSFKKFFFDYVTPIVSFLRFGVNVFKRRQEGLFWNEALTQSRWNAGKSIDRTFGVKSNSIITGVKLGASLAPGVEKIENGVAVFVDGKTFEFDCVVSCTGFQVNLWYDPFASQKSVCLPHIYYFEKRKVFKNLYFVLLGSWSVRLIAPISHPLTSCSGTCCRPTWKTWQ